MCADLCMRVNLPLDKKTWKSGLGHRAAGPSGAAGRRAVAGRGPLGRRGPRAAGLSRAAGRWAFGPPGRWAVAGRGPAFSKTHFLGLKRSAIHPFHEHDHRTIEHDHRIFVRTMKKPWPAVK